MSRRRAPLFVIATAAVTVLGPAAQAAPHGQGSPMHVREAGGAPTGLDALDVPSGPRARGDVAARGVVADPPPTPDDADLLGVDPTDPQIGRIEPPSAPQPARRSAA